MENEKILCDASPAAATPMRRATRSVLQLMDNGNKVDGKYNHTMRRVLHPQSQWLLLSQWIMEALSAGIFDTHYQWRWTPLESGQARSCHGPRRDFMVTAHDSHLPSLSLASTALKMHHCLSILEILDLICDNLDGSMSVPGPSPRLRTLANLARTCTLFSEPALDALWRTQTSLNPLFGVMAADLFEPVDDLDPDYLRVWVSLL
jgi:hypothetical protein